MGQADGGMHLVQTPADVQQLDVRDPAKLAFVTQTTLSVDDAAQIVAALRARFPEIRGPKQDDICYATQNRQDAVKFMAPRCDVVIVVGSPNSSNSNRLREIGAELNVPSYLIDDANIVDAAWFKDARTVGLTAGASAPEELVNEVLERLAQFGPIEVHNLEGIEENVRFKLPEMLWDVAESPYGGPRPAGASLAVAE